METILLADRWITVSELWDCSIRNDQTLAQLSDVLLSTTYKYIEQLEKNGKLDPITKLGQIFHKRESPKTFREGLSTRCILNTWNNRLPHVYPEYGCAAYRAILTNHLFENASMVMSKLGTSTWQSTWPKKHLSFFAVKCQKSLTNPPISRPESNRELWAIIKKRVERRVNKIIRKEKND